MVAVLHDDDEESGLGPVLIARARERSAPDVVVEALRSITRRKDPSEPGGWESYQHSLIPRAAIDDIGRVVKLFDSLVGMLPWHAVQARRRPRASSSRSATRPPRRRCWPPRRCGAVRAWRAAFPVERGAFLRYGGIALETRVRAQEERAALDTAAGRAPDRRLTRSWRGRPRTRAAGAGCSVGSRT